VAKRERELVAAKEAVQADGRTMSRSLAVMSHELRTPLNAVLGMAELLAGSRLDARQQRFVDQIRASGRALVDITHDLLDLSRLEAGRLDVVSQPFRLQEAVTEAVEMYREHAESRALALVTHIDESLPETVSGDVAHLRQILGNLLSNAIKFTERGSVILRVTPSAGFVRFSVSDTGVGIAPDFMPHIYEAFRQADNSPTRRFGGTGLGLAIARHLCVAMGGRIDASSRHGKGSTFWFELPLPAVLGGATVDPGAVDYSARPRGFAANDAPGVRATPDVDVLLIEDSESNQALVRETLSNSAYRLTVVIDGTAAVQQVHARHFDIVLLDWQLPGVNGLAVLAALRDAESMQGRPRAHVIAVTAHTGPGDRETCLAAGADDYLAKPYTPAELLARMALAKVRSAPLRH
jgi:CheY-like chemotaxis protein